MSVTVTGHLPQVCSLSGDAPAAAAQQHSRTVLPHHTAPQQRGTTWRFITFLFFIYLLQSLFQQSRNPGSSPCRVSDWREQVCLKTRMWRHVEPVCSSWRCEQKYSDTCLSLLIWSSHFISLIYLTRLDNHFSWSDKSIWLTHRSLEVYHMVGLGHVF